MEELFHRFSGAVMVTALRVLRSRAEAEEVVQDTFFEAWRKATHYQAERADFLGWLNTIARSRAVDRLRTRKSQVRAADGAAVPEESDQPSADQLLQQKRLGKELDDSLRLLTIEQRKTLELAYRENMTQSQIAAHTHTPLGTIKTRMRLATRRLQKLMGR